MAQNRFIQWVVFDWPVKVLALAAAVLFFFFVQFLQVEQRSITVRPEVEIPAIFQVDQSYVNDVKLTLRGSERDIYYIKPEDLRVILDLSQVEQPGLHTVSINIEKSSIFNRLQDVEIIPTPEQMTIYIQQRQQAL
jgi:YbbR domain-containing protein